MIIEILKESDIEKVEDIKLKSYLEYSLKRLPIDFDYYNHTHEYGYFCIVTELNDVIGNSIKIGKYTLYSFEEELFWEMVELVEILDSGVVEILVRVDNDITISIIILKNILSDNMREKIHEYIYE